MLIPPQKNRIGQKKTIFNKKWADIRIVKFVSVCYNYNKRISESQLKIVVLMNAEVKNVILSEENISRKANF